MNPAVTNKSIVEKRSCLNSVMTMWGWCFDLFTLMVNLSDVISDLLVCHQFAMDKEWVWFGLVLGSLFIGNVAFTSFLFLDNQQPIFKFIKSIKVFDQVKFLIILPFAQLIPAVAWTQHQYSLWKKRKANGDNPRAFTENLDKVPAEWAGKINMTTGAGTEEVANVVGSFHAMGRLEGAIKEHLKTHIFFYVETVVESMPQVVIQLLAITFLQKVSAVQVISMSSSLLSIVSKGYVVASSQTISAVVWKFFCCAADLFGLFYIFSSIMDRSAPQEAHLFHPDAPAVTYLTRLFVYKWTAYIGVSILFGAIIVGYTLIVKRPTMNCKAIKEVLMVLILGAFLAGPAMIGFEAIKFSVFVLILTNCEPSYGKAASALLYSYLTTGTVEDKTRKAKHLLYELANMNYEQRTVNLRNAQAKRPNYRPPLNKPMGRTLMELQLQYWCESTSDEEPSDWEDEVAISMEQKERFKRQKEKQQEIESQYDLAVVQGTLYALDLTRSTEYMIPAGTDYDTYMKLYIGGCASRAERIMRRRLIRKGGDYFNDGDGDELKVAGAPLEVKCTDGPTKAPRVTKYAHRMPFFVEGIDEVFYPSIRTSVTQNFSSGINWGNIKWENVFGALGGVIYVLMIVLGQLFSALFPLINYPRYYSSQNLLQQMCFFCYAFCLLMILVLLVPVIKYGLFNRRFGAVRTYFNVSNQVGNIFTIIENEHLPSMEALVKDFSSCGLNGNRHQNTLLAPELASLVSTYMQHSDLDLRGVGQVECRRIKEIHRR